MGNLDTSFLQMFLEASFVVQFVMITLLLASVVSWSTIFLTRSRLRKAEDDALEFEKRFWSGVELSKLYNRIVADKIELRGLESIFVGGFKELMKLQQQNVRNYKVIIPAMQRMMKINIAKEVSTLESQLPSLATIQSTSPYIGLFGTVWGIMHAFKGLSMVQQATIAMVAPGISEALIATAMGLIAAIPAGIAFNRFNTSVNAIANKYEVFSEEMIAIMYRQLIPKSPEASAEKNTDEFNVRFNNA